MERLIYMGVPSQMPDKLKALIRNEFTYEHIMLVVIYNTKGIICSFGIDKFIAEDNDKYMELIRGREDYPIYELKVLEQNQKLSPEFQMNYLGRAVRMFVELYVPRTIFFAKNHDENRFARKAGFKKLVDTPDHYVFLHTENF